MQIKDVNSDEFKSYGRIVSRDFPELIDAMKNTPLPEDVIYVASDEMLEQGDAKTFFANSFYGGMPIQIGYCNGHNQLLNGLEYHRCSEINIAVTDMILLLGNQQDIEQDYTYDTSKVEAFFVKAGTVVEMYATTLHYAPCGIDGSEFRCVVILPKGTNEDCEALQETQEDKLLAAKNKWLIAHEDAHIEGAFVGLKGENIRV